MRNVLEGQVPGTGVPSKQSGQQRVNVVQLSIMEGQQRQQELSNKKVGPQTNRKTLEKRSIGTDMPSLTTIDAGRNGATEVNAVVRLTAKNSAQSTIFGKFNETVARFSIRDETRRFGAVLHPKKRLHIPIRNDMYLDQEKSHESTLTDNKDAGIGIESTIATSPNRLSRQSLV